MTDKTYSQEEIDELRESLELCFSEYMAGGFDEKWIRDEVKDVFGEAEGYYCEDKEIPDDVCIRWANVGKFYKDWEDLTEEETAELLRKHEERVKQYPFLEEELAKWI